jgi:hypothetical protein
VSIKIARVGKTETTYYQYNTNNYDFYKLNCINDGVDEPNILTIEDNYLRWTWENKAGGEPTPTSFYVVLKNTTADTSKKILTTANAIDMRTVGLKENDSYDVSIIALNFNQNVVASRESEKINTMLYPTPIAVDVVDGQIVYNHDAFLASDFMQDIIEYFGQATPEQSLHSQIGLEVYQSPFAFTVPTFDKAMLQMRIISFSPFHKYQTEFFQTFCFRLPFLKYPKVVKQVSKVFAPPARSRQDNVHAFLEGLHRQEYHL